MSKTCKYTGLGIVYAMVVTFAEKKGFLWTLTSDCMSRRSLHGKEFISTRLDNEAA
jgi:hypothetical protein